MPKLDVTPNQRAAIVTGASRGIGRAIAERLAAEGWGVVVNYAGNQAAAEETAAGIRRRGGAALACRADVSDAEARERLVDETLATFGRVDALVNNAGITSVGRRDLLEATEESWDAVFNTNLKGPFFLTQLVAKKMTAGDSPTQGVRPSNDLRTTEEIAAESAGEVRGVIINISSISAYAVSTNRADYCMTKAAMRMMTWLYADRLAESGIRVYEVCPGVIASDMTAPVREKYDRLIADGLSPIRRWGKPEDVAAAVAMLAAGTLAFSTGDCLNIDGGFHLRRL